MVLPETDQEKLEFEHIILDGNTGTGTIYTGEYYHLDYQPYRENRYDCVGVSLISRRNSNQYAGDFNTPIIRKNLPTGLFSKLLKSESYNKRLKFAINSCIDEIKKREMHINKMHSRAHEIVSKQKEIDTDIEQIGKELDLKIEPIKLINQSFKAKSEFCPKCGKQTDITGKFCQWCGATLE